MSERFIFCKGERLAFQTISLITNKYGAQVFPHLRIKEVANRDWIHEDDFDYALKGHIDFTVAKDFRPVLAIELDGKFHQSVKARERDRKKDAICDSLQIPLVRVDSGFMRPELLQPVLSELVEVWLSDCDTRALEFAHLHSLSANWLQLEEAVNYNRDTLEIPEDAEWHLEVTCQSFDGGYSEAFVELVFPMHRVELGRGRSKVPPRSRICGRFLAERIAAADAASYIRTIGGTIRDTTSETKLPLESSCESCAARLAAMTPPDVVVHETGTRNASAGAQTEPSAGVPRKASAGTQRAGTRNTLGSTRVQPASTPLPKHIVSRPDQPVVREPDFR